MTLKRIYIILALHLFIATVNAQSEKQLVELNKLDEAAFAALESNDPNTADKANQLLTAGEKANSAVHQINGFTILGIINKNKGYYVTSVDYYNKALKVAEDTDDLGRISACYNNIGSVYQIQENYHKALFYYKKSLTLEEKLQNPLQKSIRLYNIGEIYREMDSLSLALSHFNSSLILEKQHKNNEGIVYALLGIADVYLQLNRPTDASVSLEEADHFFTESDIEIQILYHSLTAEVLYKLGELDSALHNLRKAKDISEKNEFRIHLMDIYEKEVEIKQAQDEKEQTNQNSENKKEITTSSRITIWLIIISLISVLGFVILLNRQAKKKRMAANPKSSSQPAPLVFKLENEKNKVLIEVELNNIICFEANDNYVNIYYLLNDEPKKSIQRISLRKVEEQLTNLQSEFSRVHKSYLINPNCVKKIGGKAQAYRITLQGLEFEIPVSRNFDISLLKG